MSETKGGRVPMKPSDLSNSSINWLFSAKISPEYKWWNEGLQTFYESILMWEEGECASINAQRGEWNEPE